MKKKQIEEPMELKLTQEEYWEWLCSIQAMGRKKAELETLQTESKVLTLEAQIKQMQLQLHVKTRLENGKTSVENSRKEYEEIKKRIENRLGISLNDKMIDEVTLEVKSVPENNQTKG